MAGLDIFHEDGYQRKIAAKTTAAGYMWSGVLSHAHTCLELFSEFYEFGWSGGGAATLKIIEDERLIQF